MGRIITSDWRASGVAGIFDGAARAPLTIAAIVMSDCERARRRGPLPLPGTLLRHERREICHAPFRPSPPPGRPGPGTRRRTRAPRGAARERPGRSAPWRPITAVSHRILVPRAAAMECGDEGWPDTGRRRPPWRRSARPDDLPRRQSQKLPDGAPRRSHLGDHRRHRYPPAQSAHVRHQRMIAGSGGSTRLASPGPEPIPSTATDAAVP